MSLAPRRAVEVSDSEPDPPGTWERHIESVERFRSELGIETCVLVVHNWGGLVGLRWACEHADAVRALVISSTGFFPDGKWHGMANAMREPGTGEQLMDGIDRDGFTAVMRQSSTGMTDEAIAEYWKGYADDTRRKGQLELYRSGDFSKLEGYDLAALRVPTLLLWGERDPRVPRAEQDALLAGIHGSRLVAFEGVGHMLHIEEPARTGVTRSADGMAEPLSRERAKDGGRNPQLVRNCVPNPGRAGQIAGRTIRLLQHGGAEVSRPVYECHY